MAIFHNRKLFPYLNSTEINNYSSPPTPCYDFCDPSCTHFQDCYYFPDPPEDLSPPPFPMAPPLPPAVEQVYQLSPLLIIVVVVIATVFFLVSCSAFVLKCFTSWRRYLTWRNQRDPPQPGQLENQNVLIEMGDEDPAVDHPIWLISTVGLHESVINAITMVRYKREEGLIEGSDCSVCLGEFEEGEILRLLPKCNHAFHIHCIDPWLRSHTNCPLCRAGIMDNPGTRWPVLGPTQMEDSDSSEVELGRIQTGHSENRGSSDHDDHDNPIPVNHDQNKARLDEIVNNHSGIWRRSYSLQLNLGSNWSLFRSSCSSSWRSDQEVRCGPIKRSYSWSERVCGSINHHNSNSRFSP